MNETRSAVLKCYRKVIPFPFEIWLHLLPMIKKLVWICLAIFLVTTAVFAQQIGGGTFNGTVTDPSGASIANAKVTATQTATGVARTAQSSEAGLYSLSSLPPGIYDVQIEASGFKTAKLSA